MTQAHLHACSYQTLLLRIKSAGQAVMHVCVGSVCMPPICLRRWGLVFCTISRSRDLSSTTSVIIRLISSPGLSSVHEDNTGLRLVVLMLLSMYSCSGFGKHHNVLWGWDQRFGGPGSS